MYRGYVYGYVYGYAPLYTAFTQLPRSKPVLDRFTPLLLLRVPELLLRVPELILRVSMLPRVNVAACVSVTACSVLPRVLAVLVRLMHGFYVKDVTPFP